MFNMKKRVCLVVLFVVMTIILISTVYAQTEEVDKAYNWAIKEVTSRGWNALTVREHSFALLALGYDPNYRAPGRTSLIAKSLRLANGERCWGDPDRNLAPASENNCYLLSTAMAKLALEEINYNPTEIDLIQDWLARHNLDITSDLFWYLELDSNKAMTCTISYKTSDAVGGDHIDTVTMNDDKTLVLTNPTTSACFENRGDINLDPNRDSYWLKIKNDATCYNIYYIVSCQAEDLGNYVATIFYKKDPDDRIYYLYNSVASQESAGNIQLLPISAKCFPKTANDKTCDYETTGWVGAVLEQQGFAGEPQLRKLLPYLVAYKDDNEKYLPLSFLYAISEINYFGSALVNSQSPAVLSGQYGGTAGGFWVAENSAYGKYYDTALSCMALGANGVFSSYPDAAESITNAKRYLVRPDVQAADGYWAQGSTVNARFRDTNFLLWACFSTREWIDDTDCEEAGYNCYVSACPTNYLTVNLACEANEICCRPRTACEQAGGVCQETTCDSNTQQDIYSELRQSCIDAGLGNYCCINLNSCERSGGTCRLNLGSASNPLCPSGQEDGYASLNSACELSYGTDYICCFSSGTRPNECEEQGDDFVCRDECDEYTETQVAYSCPEDEVCCHSSGGGAGGGGGNAGNTECETVYNYICRDVACLPGEIQMTYDCSTYGVCCAPCETIYDCLEQACEGYQVKDYNDIFGLCEYYTETKCSDGFDNDGDGDVDCSDYDCYDTTDCAGAGETTCEGAGHKCCAVGATGSEHFTELDSTCDYGNCYEDCGICSDVGYCCDECDGTYYSEFDDTCLDGKQCCSACGTATQIECNTNSDCEKGYKCSNNECVKAKSTTWLWILIIVFVVIIAGLVYYYFVVMKKGGKGKPRKEEIKPGFPPTSRPPINRPLFPPIRPTTQQPNPLFRPPMTFQPKPPMMQQSKTTTMTKKVAPRTPRSKTEKELESTFSKLKGLTKKK